MANKTSHSLPSSLDAFSKTVSLGCGCVDWKETLDEHMFEVDVPGFKKGQVKVDIEDGRFLCISGDRKHDFDQKNTHTHRWCWVKRCSNSKFAMKITLPPEAVVVKELKAAIKHGVLTITVPKVKVKDPPCVSSEKTLSTSRRVPIFRFNQLKGDVHNTNMMKENVTSEDELHNKRLPKRLTLDAKSNCKTNVVKELKKKRTALQVLPQNPMNAGGVQTDQ